MSNIINKIRLSGTDYTLSATTSGGVTSGEVETMISAATSGYTARFAEDEEVTAAALNNLNDRISGISGNNAVEVTQAEYDALVSGGTVDQTAFYIITDATPVDISNYWTSAQTNSAINAAVSGKQDTLSAGTGIDITDNVISATGGGGKAVSGGTNISITTGETADTINCTLPITADTKYNYIFTSNSTTIASNKMENVTFGTNNYLDCNSSFIIGGSNRVYGNGCFVYGYLNEPRKLRNCLFGDRLKSTNSYEFGFGQYNNSVSASTTFGDSGNTLFSVGNGTANNARHNAFEIRQNGDIYFYDGTNDVKLQDKFSSLDTTIGNINTILESI